MNKNLVITDDWSSPDSEDLYLESWRKEPDVRAMRERGEECRTCSFWAPFSPEWGLCCHAKSRHHSETVFSHFTCPVHVEEGLGPHSFSEDEEAHCRCGGHGAKYIDRLSTILEEIKSPQPDDQPADTEDWPEGLFDEGEEPQ